MADSGTPAGDIETLPPRGPCCEAFLRYEANVFEKELGSSFEGEAGWTTGV